MAALSLLLIFAAPLVTAQDAEVTVRVVAASGDEAPLPGARVWLRTEPGSSGGRVVDGPRGEVGNLLTADDLGEVIYSAPAGEFLLLDVQGARIEFSDHEEEVPALAPDERRTITVRLAPGERRPFHGRLIDRETGRPIVAARLHDSRSDGSFTLGSGSQPGRAWSPLGPLLGTSDPEGRFELEWRSWRVDWVHVFAEGYSANGFAIEASRGDPADPKHLRVSRSAAVVGHYWNAEGEGVPGVLVEVRLYSWQLYRPGPDGGVPGAPDVSWEVRSDEQGHFELEGLPARVPLTFTMLDARRRRLHEQEITLQPGERRDLSTSARTEHELNGVLLDEAGAPIAGVDIQLSPARVGTRKRLGYLSAYGDHDRNTRTDRAGRFKFDRVAFGEWFVGVRPLRSQQQRGLWAPFGQRVHVPTGHELTLRGHQGFITGRVLDETGEPIVGAGLYALALDHFGMVHGWTEDDGSFRLGPLGPGQHSLNVGPEPDGLDYGWVCDDVVCADPGDADLEFVMQRSGIIVGRAVDSRTGAPCEAEFSALSETTRGGASYPRPQERARFKWLAPGTYLLVATTEDGRIGIRRGIEVQGDETSAEQVVQLEPGGRLKLGPPGAYAARMYSVR